MVGETRRVSEDCRWVGEKGTTWAVRVTRDGQTEPEEHRLEVSQIIGQFTTSRVTLYLL